jgi:hypothetical protein
MEVAAIIGAAASILSLCLRYWLIWRLCVMADRSGRQVRISGLNPLAIQVEYMNDSPKKKLSPVNSKEPTGDQE